MLLFVAGAKTGRISRMGVNVNANNFLNIGINILTNNKYLLYLPYQS